MSGILTAIGLMSGTSMDGIDVALIETDGEAHVRPGPASSQTYNDADRAIVRAAVDAATTWEAGAPVPEAVTKAEARITEAHGEAVNGFLAENGIAPGTVDVIGFHGQTILHQPDRQRTVQIGQGDRLAALTGIDVVNDFRSADVAAGGEGAPFAPLYHRALAQSVKGEGALAVLNLGGVGNVTWLGEGDNILAFDTGPANGLIDDWVLEHGAGTMDINGALAQKGTVDGEALTDMLDNPFFAVTPPKSLDRLDFAKDRVSGLSLEDGAATLTAFTAACVEKALAHLPTPPAQWIVCGGGRKNPTLMGMLAERLPGILETAEDAGWRGDDLEAEAFAYLAVRSLRGLPLSVPGTTGVPEPMTGGRHNPAPGKAA